MLIDFRKLFPKYGIKPKGVLHVGANIGEEFDVYNELGIKNQIWVEAHEPTFNKLKAHVGSNPNAICWNACISDENYKDVKFKVSNNGSQSSSILELGTHKQAHPEVFYIQTIDMKTRRLDDLFRSDYVNINNYDLLNLDLQGNELRALKGLGELINNFSWIYSEVNKQELYEKCALVEDLDYFLGPHGFTRVETFWTQWSWGDALWVKE